MPVTLEVCIASAEDALAAERGGAGRLELNTALGLGGLTPSMGLTEAVAGLAGIPVIAMIRPRPGGFFYSATEFEVMKRDLDLVLEAGADGVAFGILNENGTIDTRRSRELVARCQGRPAVFHRAFDVTPDPFVAFEILADLGITRVMTSGQAPTALEGANLIAELIDRARGRIEILPAGGIRSNTVREILARTGAGQVHASLRGPRTDPSTRARPAIRFGAAHTPPEDRIDATDAMAVADLAAILAGG